MAENEVKTGVRDSLYKAVVQLACDGWSACRFLLGWRPQDPEGQASAARGALFFPLLGAAAGSFVVEILGMLPVEFYGLRVGVGVVLLALVSGGRSAFDLFRFCGGGLWGVLVLSLVWVVEIWALSGLHGNLLAIALVMTPMLGRWAYVVQAYGSLPAKSDGLASSLVRHLQFTQFATASVTAMALSLMLINALGTLLLFVVASMTIGLRILTHTRQGGVSSVSLGAGACLAEAVTLVSAGAIARMVAGG